MKRLTLFLPWIVLTFATLILWPGVNGPFLLDDFLHFPKLGGDDGQIDSYKELVVYLFNHGSATGRPLSFASLLINDNQWPAPPLPFKTTNLLIHILNGALVFSLTLSLIKWTRANYRSAAWAVSVAALVSFLWLISPVQLSAVFLTIQRMTLLASTMMLLGLIFHVRYSARPETWTNKNYIVATSTLYLLLGLAILFKETGINLLIFILAYELTLGAGRQTPKRYKIWLLVGVTLPYALANLYPLLSLDRMHDLYLKRDFGPLERILTEPRVLAEYLRLTLIPGLSGSGPYRDAFPVSRGLLSPPSTLLWISVALAAIGFAIRFRKRYPLIAFAVLWFMLGHLLESTFLPLEIFFQHRNYLPSFGVIFAFAVSALDTQRAPQSLRLRSLVSVLIAAYLAFVAHENATVWGSRPLQAAIWAAEHPESRRAQIDALRFWLSVGDAEQIAHHHSVAVQHHPDDAGIKLFGFIIDRCNPSRFTEVGASMESLRSLIPRAPFDHASIEGLKFILNEGGERKCSITDEEVRELIELYLQNPRFQGVDQARAFLWNGLAKLAIRRGDLDAAIRAIDETYAAAPDYQYRLNQAYLLGTAGLFSDAWEYVEKAERDSPHGIGSLTLQRSETENMKKLLRQMEKSGVFSSTPEANDSLGESK